jgi:regulator of protease activity HflC (stomatin/prohibitin superfamily)
LNYVFDLTTFLINLYKGRIDEEGCIGPGRIKYYGKTDKIEILNIQEDTFDLGELELITSDGKPIIVVALLNYQITDPVTAIINVRNWDQAIRLVCACLLRDAVGYNTFDTLQMDKKKIQNNMEVI